jgi:regulator of replication initiation timing
MEETEDSKDESDDAHDRGNMNPRKSSRDSGYGDYTKQGTTSGKSDDASSLKRLRDNPAENSDDISIDIAGRFNVDEPSIEGDNVGVSEEMRLEERRAYNRRNAARSRQRVKDQLRDLQQQVVAQTASRSELERSNVRLLAENNVLRDEVHKLRSLLSGAPLFGTQTQAVQPFLQQQYPMSSNPNVQFVAQGAPHPSSRTIPSLMGPPASQMSFPTVQQQGLLGYFPPMTPSQIQQDPSLSASAAPLNQMQMAGSAADTNQQNAFVQLLLQQFMSNNGNVVSNQMSNNTGTQNQPSPLHQQYREEPPQQEDHTLSTFDADGTSSSLQQQAFLRDPLSTDGLQAPAPEFVQNSYPLQHQTVSQPNAQDVEQPSLLQQQPNQDHQQRDQT